MKEREAAATPAERVTAPPRLFGEAAPFLEQSRAQNTLRHELERLFADVKRRIDDAKAIDADAIIEFSALPNRIIARCGALAISCSWLTGRLGGVSDGHLLVIEWAGLSNNHRGVAALKSATMSRETSYRPEAADAASWCWQAAEEQGRTCSTLDLVGEWFDAFGTSRHRSLASA